MPRITTRRCFVSATIFEAMMRIMSSTALQGGVNVTGSGMVADEC